MDYDTAFYKTDPTLKNALYSMSYHIYIYIYHSHKSQKMKINITFSVISYEKKIKYICNTKSAWYVNVYKYSLMISSRKAFIHNKNETIFKPILKFF